MTKHAKLLHDESSIVRFARKQIEGKITGLETRDFYDAIVKCADARRAPGESDAQAFTKTIIEDETGRLLFKALQLAPSSTTTAQPTNGPYRGSRSGLPTASTPTATATT